MQREDHKANPDEIGSNPSDVSPGGKSLDFQPLVLPVKEVLLAEAALQKTADRKEGKVPTEE
jgi:hypothetical protein